MAKTLQRSSVGNDDLPQPQPIQDGLGATILGPRNVPLERENPDQLLSP